MREATDDNSTSDALLTSKQRAYLRSLASNADTIIQIGKGGITDNLIKTVGDALEARELIKARTLENSGIDAREAAEQLAEAVSAQVVAVTGTRFVLYRRSKTSKRHIELP